VTATYRLQLHAGFTFADAEATVPYLADLGIAHLYLSPVLEAVPGSAHGYDVLDHSRVSADLGGLDGLESLAATAREAGIGTVVDVVPNHMALVGPEHANPALWQVLGHGQQASTAHWFDVDWAHLDGRLGLPVLGKPLAAAIADGEITRDEYDGQPVVRYLEHVLPLAAGTEDGPLPDVLDRQHYLLASWQEKDEVLNYRRFFEVDSLIAVRVEDADVFEQTHRLLLDLNRRGIVEGFRIDHPDGLADPEGYLERLRAATLPGTGIWVEKILEPGERLPTDWPCEGSTGYDAIRVVSAALLDPTTEPALTQAWEQTGAEPSFEATAEAAKRTVVEQLLVPERRRLVRRALEALPGADPERIAQALVELLVAAPVYRAYIRPGRPPGPEARARLAQASDAAVAARPDLKEELDQLLELASGTRTEPAALDFAVRLQQTWGPVMAKAIEDTAFYRWNRMVALNEVGGDPLLLESASPDLMHRWAAGQQPHWPLGMTAQSTHDTKRSADVRGRLIALSGDGESWLRCSEAFATAADEHGVDRPTGHLLWQTLAGVGVIDRDRMHAYLTKAVREAKQHTAWVDGDPDYEARVLALADTAMAPGELHALVSTAVDRNAEAIRAVVLGQKLLQLMLPGTPDTYQGCEVVDLSLVDPDNRRPVDFDATRRLLAELADRPPADLNEEKLLLTQRALALRRELPDAFADHGGYAPLDAASHHLLGFRRGQDVVVLVTRAPQRLAAAGGWAEVTVTLREALWRDELTGALYGGGAVRCADLFATLPVALLRVVT
jgi:(1->4)-alpha-D-glucan 1-alpha-D-glucosylmutase